MTTATLPILKAVDRAIAAVRERHPEIPEIVAVVGQSGFKKNGQTHGHFAKETWRRDEDGNEVTMHEIMLSGESLKRGAEATLGTIIHECVHAYCHVKEIRDTSNQGRYHNKHFKEAAEDFGLSISKAPVIGFSVTTLADGTAEEYAEELADLTEALTAWRVPKLKEVVKATKYEMQCRDCQDPVMTSKKWWERNRSNLFCDSDRHEGFREEMVLLADGEEVY